VIGDTKIIGDRIYLEVNCFGTLEKLPPLGWLNQIKVILMSKFFRCSIDDIRKLAYRKAKGGR
jgi:hypothetical protein